MNCRKIYSFSALLVLLSLFGNKASAQQGDPEKPVSIDSFLIVREYKPILADAVKIRRSPDMTNKREYMPKLSYANIRDKKLDINTGLSELKIMETPFILTRDMYSNYVKFGMGNLNTILGEAYFAIEDYEDLRFGGFAKYLSQKGNLEDQKFNRQEIGVFGRRVLSSVTLDGIIGYNRLGTRFYGIPTADGIDLNPVREPQTFNDIYFTGELTSNFDPQNEDAVSYSVKADAYNYSDKYDAKETSVALSGYLNKRVRTFNVGANVALDFNNIKGAYAPTNGGKVNNSLANINPYINFKGDNYTVLLGANLITEFGDSSRFNIFPRAEVDFSLVPEYFYIFGGVTGGVSKTSYRDLTQTNHFLGPNINIQNTIERLQVFGGIKGNAGATFGWKAKLLYRQLEGMPLFMNSATAPYQFSMVYDGDSDKKVKHVGVEGELNVRLSEAVNIGGRLNIDQYTMAYQEETWHTPKMRLAANARFNISEKLYIDAEALFHGHSYALTYDYQNPMSTTIYTTPVQKEIPSFFDLSAGAEYKATKQLGVFVKANNILNTEYQRYLYYPRLGFNVIGGINFSF